MVKLDITNQKFGRLIAEYCTDRKDNNGNYFWRCRCDCGNYVDVVTFRLRNGHTKSCGCIKAENASKLGKSNKLPDNKAALNRLYYNYRRSAAIRNLEFSLSKRYFIKLITEPCSYCGDAALNGIDRINNNQGYTVSNSQPCCGVCNKMKLTMGHKDFLDHIQKIWLYVRRDHG